MSAIGDLEWAVSRGVPEGTQSRIGEGLVVLAKHVDATNARLRQFGLHDPQCARLRDDEAGFGHRPPGVTSNIMCDCWLSRCTEGEHPVRPQTWTAVRRGCPKCNRIQVICTEGHCMICGTGTKPEEAKD